jgi:putative ABC transport system ATP-binding protein
MPLIELEDITRTYRMGALELSALRGVSLTVEAGELLAIMGASGSGKSTLLNILGTLDTPTSGHYRLDGVPLEGLDEVARARVRGEKIGFVFQSFNLLPRYTALENVELPMSYRGVSPALRRTRARAALERVGLGARVHHLPSELSGGQQQRVAIARALVNEPRLLLADEPTGALDSATTAQVLGLFEELHEEGMTVVLVTHDASVAAHAHRTVTFRDGVIVSSLARSA